MGRCVVEIGGDGGRLMVLPRALPQKNRIVWVSRKPLRHTGICSAGRAKARGSSLRCDALILRHYASAPSQVSLRAASAPCGRRRQSNSFR
jgi:hypothetical protein